MYIKNKNQGFTLIELLIVIGIIAILAAAVIITITPGERLEEAREATRAAHMAAIGTALHMAVADGDLANLAASACVNADGTTWTAFNDACAAAVGLGAAPVDPTATADGSDCAATGAVCYEILLESDGARVQIRPDTGTGSDLEPIY